jgi:hypothetical protein
MNYFDEILDKHRNNPQVHDARLIEFIGCDGYDVYNISNAFEWQGSKYLFGRVEKRESEISQVVLFEMLDDFTFKKTDTVINNFQDPAVTFIDENLILGGTRIYIDNQRIISWATTFIKGFETRNLKEFFVSPVKMKDVRLFQDKVLHVFTRPQGGEKAKLGKIGYCSFSDLDELCQEKLEEAPLLENNFDDYSWGGVNQVLALKNGTLGILGHIARMTEGDFRHYYGMVFNFCPKEKKIRDMKIICERSDFPEGEAKREDLVDVIFPGGIVRKADGRAELYVGLSDAQAAMAIITDPFIEYENDERIYNET